MAFSPGRNVGRVSIRVVPDTTRFRQQLRRQLETVEKTTTMSVRVDRANVDRTKFRESLRRQLAEFNGLDIDTNVSVTIDSAKLKRGALRKSIQEQFDQLKDVRVYIKPDISKEHQEQFKLKVKRMVDNAKATVHIGVNAHTAAATAQLRYATRPRIAEIFVRINKRSLAATVGTLAALSGARLSWKWIDDLADKMRNLDKTLPTLINWTSGITALIAAIGGSVSGLVGIGQGLFSITPALLVLPGLFLNALGSLTVLIVALKNSRTELGALGDDMNELGSIINTGFWDRARAPIVDLIKGLMPQLRNAFTELSAGVGDFTAMLANAFSNELAGGRLESIFKGIADGWRVLGTGAPAFAGAIVSLSEIAAKYTPRLAAWFVRQANTFDNFLSSIANDGRLESWMEDAIDSMYDLWSATTGFAGVLSGIWKAADLAGSGGLKGFADMLQEWNRITNSADFQTGLAAIFRGSYVAMDAFGGAIESLGRLIGDMPGQFERFVGSVGGFLGGLFDEAFKALNNTNVAIGLDGFSAGLEAALAGITPSLQPIADTFGNFLGLLGDLAGNLLPTAAGVIAALMPSIDALIGVIEPVLQPLADAVSDIATTLAPSIEGFVTALGPTFQGIITGLADALVELAPVIADLVDALSIIPDILNFGKPEALTPEKVGGPGNGWIVKLGEVLTNYKVEAEVIFKGGSGNPAKIAEAAQLVADEYKRVLETRGPEAGQAFLDGIASANLPVEFGNAVREALPQLEEFADRGRSGGGGFSRGLTEGFGAAYPELAAALAAQGKGSMDQFGSGLTAGKPGALAVIASLPPEIRAQIPADILNGVGYNITAGLASGMRSWQALDTVRAAARLAVGEAVAAARGAAQVRSPSRVMAAKVGRWLPAGVAMGMDQYRHLITASARRMVDFDPFGAVRSGETGQIGGTNVQVTMPLLEGETPQEQRDNVIKEIQWAL